MQTDLNFQLYKVFAYKFFASLVLITPFYVVMFSDFNMSATQIGILLGAWSITQFVLEVPSGVLADKYSRKHLLFYAQLLKGVGCLVWILFPTFWGFLVGFVLWGLKSALASGTFEALLYDLLDKNGVADKYTKITGRARGFEYAGGLLAAAGAAIAIQHGYTFVLLVSIAALVISAISIISIPRTQAQRTTGEVKYFSILTESLHTIKSKPVLIYLILFLVFVNGVGGALDEYWPLFAEQIGTPDYGIAIFIGLISAVQIVASVFAHKLDNVTQKVLYGFLIALGMVLVAASYLFTLPALLLIIAFSGIATALSIVYEGRMQHQITDNIRATVGSVNGFFVEVMALMVYISFGWLADLYEYQTAFLLFGYLMIFVGLIYLVRHVIHGKIKIVK